METLNIKMQHSDEENHSSRQEDLHHLPTSQHEERTDAGYIEWQAWLERDKIMKETERERKEEAAKKEKSWALYRECEKLIQENKNAWHERQETEKLRRLKEKEKEEKLARLAAARNQKKLYFKNVTAPNKKETKLDTSRRLEETKKLEGKQKMRSELWRKRREKDGMLVKVWVL